MRRIYLGWSSSLTCLGWTTASAIPTLASAPATGISTPSVASRIASSAPGSRRLSNSLISFSSLGTEKFSPFGPIATRLRNIRGESLLQCIYPRARRRSQLKSGNP